MLVLSRQRDETIIIGDDVQITVVDIRGDKVRLGISAPAHISVHRKEVYDAIQQENQQASTLRPEDLSTAVGGHANGTASPAPELNGTPLPPTRIRRPRAQPPA